MKKTFENIAGILFDMDGTLVNSTQAVENAWKAWAKKHGLDPEMVVKIAHGRPATDTISRLAPELDLQVEAQWVLARELAEDAVVAIPGILEFLASLGDLPWGIVTSANRSLAVHRLRLANIPIPKVFVTFDDVTKGKPDPQGYLLAARGLALAPRECLVVEDTPAGLMAGREAGMRLLGICTTFSVEELSADAHIKNYLQISYDSTERSLEIET